MHKGLGLPYPESGICANVSHSLTESMLFRECGVLPSRQKYKLHAADLLFWEGGGRWKAKSNKKRKNYFGKVVPLDVFF